LNNCYFPLNFVYSEFINLVNTFSLFDLVSTKLLLFKLYLDSELDSIFPIFNFI